MAFITGTVNSLAELRQALINGCTANGWTLSGTVLSKGTCFVDLPATDSNSFKVTGGTGIAAGVLTGVSPASPSMCNSAAVAFTWPANYRLHIMGSEVYLLLRYSVDRYQWLAFGQSPTAGLPGTGNWCGGSFENYSVGDSFSITPANGGEGGYYGSSGALFWQTTNHVYVNGRGTNCFVHHGLLEASSAGGWSGRKPFSTSNTVDSMADAIGPLVPLMARQPSAGNSEVILLPIRPVVVVPENKVAAVLEIAASRFMRIDNYAPEQIISLGSDRWCVYPWVRKNSVARDGGRNIDHSGTLGWAIRYDGP